MAKKKATKKEENSLNLETILFNCRDYLRGSASLNDKRDVILTLVFLRFIGEKFDDAQTPGASVEFDPEEAELAGAFKEDSISEQEAIESSIDQI